jgi:hypothetical protein
LNNAFYWWKYKMIYAIYKYEIEKGAKLREVMKGTISVEHILPQEWNWEWVNDDNMKEKREETAHQITSCINGVGNLLLITPGENSTMSNHHPSDKCYGQFYDGGSYKAHSDNRETWKSATKWCDLIRERGEQIYDFMLNHLIGNGGGENGGGVEP